MRYQVFKGPHILDRSRAPLSLDLARDLALDAGPRRRREHDETVYVPRRRSQHDDPVEFLRPPRIGALALLRRRPAVRRQPQQMLGTGESLLGVAGEVAGPPRNRLRLRDVERGNVFANRGAVFELGVAVTEDVVDGLRP